MTYTIKEKTGVSFAVAVDHLDRSTRFRVQNPSPGMPAIGHANLWDSGNGVLDLLEIAIEENVTFRNPSFVKRWFKPQVSFDYRRRGLGTALLECVIAHARRAACRLLIISRVHGFENSKVGLEAWYRRHGFAPGGDGRLQMEFGE